MCWMYCCFIFQLMLGDFGLFVVCVAVSADVERLWVVCCMCCCLIFS